MPEVHCFVKEKLFPQKAVLLLNSVPFYPRTLSSGGDLMTVKFLPPQCVSYNTVYGSRCDCLSEW
jgi:hypothetical protein